jgi:hypothetical protein
MLGRHRGALLFFFFSSSSLLLLLPLLIIIVRHCTLSYRIFGRVLLVFCIIVSSRLVLSAGRSGQDRTGQGLRAGHANPPRGVGREGKGSLCICMYVCSVYARTVQYVHLYCCDPRRHLQHSQGSPLPSSPSPTRPAIQKATPVHNKRTENERETVRSLLRTTSSTAQGSRVMTMMVGRTGGQEKQGDHGQGPSSN